MKWVAQMPQPVAAPAATIQVARGASRHGPCSTEQADGGEAGQEADNACHNNEAPVVLGDKAGKDAEHYLREL